MTQISVKATTSVVTFSNRWDHFLARWRVNRSGHRIDAGLYSLGSPTGDSPVFVTANYTLSFDALRSALRGVDGYILVLDTNGINVWCAAGKGTFGTGELVNRIGVTHLDGVVRHRKLLLPQLGASGVAAHEVKKHSGFRVEYGPVRAVDLPEYLNAGKATPEMRRIRFDLPDRIALIPVELVGVLLPMLVLAVVLYFLAGGLWASVGVVSAILAGVILFPVLLPWLPTRDFSTKGFILGAVVALILFLVK
ncbi:MAG: carbon monoxide dehydrogenase, partial [Chloroflexi bacterium]|nr:carbon monoxide dehydrogenase [Chloroflexota bacterium]